MASATTDVQTVRIPRQGVQAAPSAQDTAALRRGRGNQYGALVPQPAPPAPAVHRVRGEDVLVRDWRRTGEGEFVVGLDWSGEHCFFGPGPGSAHPEMLLGQTLRQVGFLVAHTGLGVPRDNEFLMRDLSYEADPHRPTARRAPRDLSVKVRIVLAARRTLGLRMSLECDGEPFATGGGTFDWVPRQVYRRMRGDFLTARPGPSPAPVAPALVGRERLDEVALAPSGRPDRWQLRGDTGHLAFFDHGVDHMPGLVVAEAAQQAAYAVAADRAFCPVRLDLKTWRYVEFDAPCWVEAHEVAARTARARGIEVIGRQRGETVFECLVEGVRSPLVGG
ncbi:ScbA/BarX family gamma-butyrolactone biosynthesis protein [Streptomyces sp. NPDC041068]|uniref:ScbA/BarX family gamma-butyrolactone biosynthesis protein n=1 Tax=Streptomyces sp. NPDC041068 TaxID=3155130 RepID=UPI0033D0AA54